MKKVFLVLGAMTVLLSSCLHTFKKAPGGLEYKIFSGGSGDKIAYGNFFELSFNVRYKDAEKDTLLQSSDNFGTQIGMLDSTAIPAGYFKIFSQLSNHDSVIIRIPTDTIVKTGQAPPFIKRGEYIVATYKILNVFTSKMQADSAFKAQRAILHAKDSVAAIAQLATDSKIITDYLAKNNITTVKGAKGTFVAIHTPGTGALLDTSVAVKVNYTGKTLDGSIFDSNVDPSFNHTTPLTVKMWLPQEQGGVIEGWTDGLKLLSKGAKATLYIPSSLAYGKQGAGGGKIKSNAILIFDVEVVDVQTRAQAQAEEDVERAKMEAMRKHYMDSVQQVQKNMPQAPAGK